MPWDNVTGLRWLGFAALGLVVVGNAAGNVLLKIGADVVDRQRMLFGIVAWQSVLGMACFGFGLIAYAWALKQFDLHAAQIVVSLQYVLAIFLAVWLLGEQISPSKWLGIGLIAIGLYVCTR
jgi:drug/metabolite transporter (DMT)-like permease